MFSTFERIARFGFQSYFYYLIRHEICFYGNHSDVLEKLYIRSQRKWNESCKLNKRISSLLPSNELSIVILSNVSVTSRAQWWNRIKALSIQWNLRLCSFRNKSRSRKTTCCATWLNLSIKLFSTFISNCWTYFLSIIESSSRRQQNNFSNLFVMDEKKSEHQLHNTKPYMRMQMETASLKMIARKEQINKAINQSLPSCNYCL